MVFKVFSWYFMVYGWFPCFFFNKGCQILFWIPESINWSLGEHIELQDHQEKLARVDGRTDLKQQISLHTFMQVASQCLQSAYALNTEDKHLAVSKPLQAIFQEATMNEPVGTFCSNLHFVVHLSLLSCKRSHLLPLPTRRRRSV